MKKGAKVLFIVSVFFLVIPIMGCYHNHPRGFGHRSGPVFIQAPQRTFVAPRFDDRRRFEHQRRGRHNDDFFDNQRGRDDGRRNRGGGDSFDDGRRGRGRGED